MGVAGGCMQVRDKVIEKTRRLQWRCSGGASYGLWGRAWCKPSRCSRSATGSWSDDGDWPAAGFQKLA